jgi:hypothetical protein
MLAAVHTPTEFSPPWHHVCRAAGRLLLVAGSIVLANAAALLTLHAGAAGVSQFVDTAVARSGRKPSLGQSEAPTALHGADVRSLFETAAPPPCQAQAPAPVGIHWTAPPPTARRPEVIR